MCIVIVILYIFGIIGSYVGHLPLRKKTAFLINVNDIFTMN